MGRHIIFAIVFLCPQALHAAFYGYAYFAINVRTDLPGFYAVDDPAFLAEGEQHFESDTKFQFGSSVMAARSELHWPHSQTTHLTRNVELEPTMFTESGGRLEGRWNADIDGQQILDWQTLGMDLVLREVRDSGSWSLSSTFGGERVRERAMFKYASSSSGSELDLVLKTVEFDYQELVFYGPIVRVVVLEFQPFGDSNHDDRKEYGEAPLCRSRIGIMDDA